MNQWLYVMGIPYGITGAKIEGCTIEDAKIDNMVVPFHFLITQAKLSAMLSRARPGYIRRFLNWLNGFPSM